MIGAILGTVLRLVVHSVPTLLGFGTLMGTDKHMKYGTHKSVGPWVVVSMSALERTAFIDAFDIILQIKDDKERAFSFNRYQLQIIAASVRNRLGYFLFDAFKSRHLDKLSLYPQDQLNQAFKKACELSCLDFLLGPEKNKTNTGESQLSESESDQLKDHLFEDDGLDFPEEGEDANPNP